MDRLLAPFAPQMLSVLRIMTGLAFLSHGTRKLLDFPTRGGPAPEFLSMIWFAGAIEIVGGALLVLGLFTRPVAFVVAGHAAAAYFIGHFPRGFIPLVNGGTAAYLYCFAFLYIACAGAGPWSLDAMLRGRQEADVANR